MKEIRVGVVGVGYLGKFHAEKYARMDDVELVGVVDIDAATAANVAAAVSTTPYAEYKDLFGKVDAVSIVVPTSEHFSVCREFLQQDVDVLVEKPMTTTLEEADELIRISEERNLILQVGHLERFNPAVVALKDILDQPMFIESHRLSMYKDRCTDVSVVHDLMIHDIDIILNVVRSDIETVRAAGVSIISEHVDIANARLEFENGCVANITASRISMKNERRLRLFQKNAYIAVDFANHEISVISRNGDRDTGLIPGMGIKKTSFAKGDALDDELKSFVMSVRRREAPEVTGHMGRDALQTVLSVMEQIRKTSSRYTT